MADAPTFAAFFRGVWRHDPHLWQVDLADQVVTEGRWPDVIDLPTGAGKTACLDIAVYALAVAPETFSRRIAFVVDRRLVVDQTVERARALADELARSLVERSADPAVRALAERLVGLAFQSPGRAPVALDVGRLRGGTDQAARTSANSAEWLRWPDQPAVVVSTVDQFGSRLLFRGYGVGPRMHPVHAGLTGNDCLILLDEVHISAPLAETLGDLAAEFATVRELPHRWQFVQMSATPVGAPQRRFALEPRHIVAGSLLAQVAGARKPARLVEVGKPKQTDAGIWRDHAVQLVEALGIERGVVGVVVNRVASARAAAEALRPLGEVVLLTGRMRPFERAAEERRALALADPDRAESPARAFVVATQCIEVGADLSFDGLVTEVSPLSSLRQRFGRLDRRGRWAAAGEPAPALIVGLASALARDPDPVYGTAMRAMWHELRHRFDEATFDVGPRSAMLVGFGADVDVAVPHPAVLMPAHLDLLAMTNPAPPNSPAVTPFLRGFARDEPDVSVVWRADVGCTEDSCGEDAAVLAVLPPEPAEMVPLPRSAAIRWLASVAARAAGDLAVADGGALDVADVDRVVAQDDDVVLRGRPVLRWRRGENPTLIDSKDVAVGDVIVVPSAFGGLAGATWAPESVCPVPDVGGPVAALTGRRIVRTAVDLDLPLPGPSADELDEFVAAVGRRLDEVAAGPSGSWLAGCDAHRVKDVGLEGAPVWAIVDQAGPDIVSFDGSDEANSAIGTPVTLRTHLAGVGMFAASFAERCFLPADLVGDLCLAGELHDLGKADPRFQVMLHGDEISALAAPEPLAKSIHRRWRFRGGYPEAMRHEFASAELIASSVELLARARDTELVMHLVTTHHGHARALPTHVDDDDPQAIEIESHGHPLTARSTFDAGTVGAASVERFARLNERYGWHGLAWLETLFRLADHRRSEEESRGTVL